MNSLKTYIEFLSEKIGAIPSPSGILDVIVGEDGHSFTDIELEADILSKHDVYLKIRNDTNHMLKGHLSVRVGQTRVVVPVRAFNGDYIELVGDTSGPVSFMKADDDDTSMYLSVEPIGLDITHPTVVNFAICATVNPTHDFQVIPGVWDDVEMFILDADVERIMLDESGGPVSTPTQDDLIAASAEAVSLYIKS